MDWANVKLDRSVITAGRDPDLASDDENRQPTNTQETQEVRRARSPCFVMSTDPYGCRNAITPIPSAQLSAVLSKQSTSKAMLGDANSSTAEEMDMRQKRLKRFENDRGIDSSTSSPTAFLNSKGKGKGKAAMHNGMHMLSLQEQREMSGPPDPVFNNVSYCMPRQAHRAEQSCRT